ncbi:Gfo/Idh/MocA family protein [Ornithinibacillus scapharcae]|uniref:Gfo/Idh/MocA family protein n=1 Tax=Ornithinibacillus scapharcae TaxID=1147159 RepID=UPI000225B593|nr:Gfo/Idh/MocA family oxidoreductase [Ornithinibacillus scapharcae]
MIKVGIIGLGAIGQRLIKQFSLHNEVEIVAVCDQVESLAQATAKELGDVQAYTSHLDLIADDHIDMVYVAVPPKYHHQVVLDVVGAKKHVLCEKPLANSLVEAEEMLRAAQDAKVVHAMNFPLNYDAEANAFADLISKNYIGKLRRLQLTMHFPQWPRVWQKNDWVVSREQGGFVLEVGVHFIQQTLKIFGDITNIQTQLEFPEDPSKSETGIIATAELADGTPVLIEGLSQIAGKEYIGFTAYGTEGILTLDNWGELKGAKNGEELANISIEDQTITSLIQELVKAIKGQKAEIYDFQVGYKAQAILEKLRNK